MHPSPNFQHICTNQYFTFSNLPQPLDVFCSLHYITKSFITIYKDHIRRKESENIAIHHKKPDISSLLTAMMSNFALSSDEKIFKVNKTSMIMSGY